MLKRRGFLAAMLAAAAAPAVVRASSLMPIFVPRPALVFPATYEWRAVGENLHEIITADAYCYALAKALRETKDVVTANIINRAWQEGPYTQLGSGPIVRLTGDVKQRVWTPDQKLNLN